MPFLSNRPVFVSGFYYQRYIRFNCSNRKGYHNRDTVRIQGGYKEDTVRIQSGYREDTVRIQGEYSQDTGRIQSGYSGVAVVMLLVSVTTGYCSIVYLHYLACLDMCK